MIESEKFGIANRSYYNLKELLDALNLRSLTNMTPNFNHGAYQDVNIEAEGLKLSIANSQPSIEILKIELIDNPEVNEILRQLKT